MAKSPDEHGRGHRDPAKHSKKDPAKPTRAKAARPELASIEPAQNARARRKQIVEAIKTAAQTLENTPAICRKSYVHPAVVTAFEAGALREFAEALKHARSDKPAQAAVGAVLLDSVAATA